MNIKILYEDKDILAVAKPAGILVHATGHGETGTLSDWMAENYPAAIGVGEPLKLASGEEVSRHGIVHRLDRDTSGVILIAKTSAGFSHLKKQFQDRTIEKTYNAFVYGEVKKETGTINLPLGRSKGDFRQYAAPARARGEMREALTYYRTLKAEDGFSFLELVPKTGRTHQLRAHLKAIEHPIVCDHIYAPGRPCVFGFKRVALHARAISFENLAGEKITVEAPYPEDFKKAMTEFCVGAKL